MKQSLQIKLGQKLTVTPQLQQAINLLQLSQQDLLLELQNTLDSNPLLEVEENIETTESVESPEVDTEIVESPTDIPDELAVDSSWEDIYPDHSSQSKTTNIDNQDINFYENIGDQAVETLHEYLSWQICDLGLDDSQEVIAANILEGIDDDGYLKASLEDILLSVQDSYSTLTIKDVEYVLEKIQALDPIGVAARNIGECLELQLLAKPKDTREYQIALQIVRHHLDLLSRKNYLQLKKIFKINDDSLSSIINLITDLNPRPGSVYSFAKAEYITPDVSVRKQNGIWVVKVNDSNMPRLRINANYAKLVKNVASSRDSKFLQERLNEAKWFMKSLQNRNETLLAVSRCIVQRQLDFFEYGEQAMQPLILQDIAMATDLHESTVSRITTNKYMHTPRGVFRLKYFFSSHLQTDTGQDMSSTAIRAEIKKIIENETKPLSDNSIANILNTSNIKIARRTVAKYRESLGIPPSSQRKVLCSTGASNHEY